MGRGSTLTEVERAKIDAWKLEGHSDREIGRRLGRSQHAVGFYLKNKGNYGSKRSPGRPSVLTTCHKRRILRHASNSLDTARVIANKSGATCHLRTVQRLLHNSGNLVHKKIARKPRLLTSHRSSRLRFGRSTMSWTKEWEKLIFSDEKKFNLDGPDGLGYYWHDLRKEERILSKRQMGGGSVMVWAAIGYRSKGPLVFCDGRMNSKKYVTMLQDNLLRQAVKIGGKNWIFQQDNASIHASRETNAFFEAKNVRILQWPSKSPDLNIIENLWGDLARAVYASGRQFNNVSELKLAITSAWSRISQEKVKNLYHSLPDRIFQIIESKGGFTRY